MEGAGPEHFRKALERLGASSQQAWRAEEQLRRTLDKMIRDVYVRHGSPFGSGEKAFQIWLIYDQFTTAN